MERGELLLSKVNISAKEWRFVGIYTGLLLVITTAPYLFASFTAPADQQFMGILLNVPDNAQYLSWYKGFQFQSIISNSLTPEPNPALFFNLLWWMLGRIGLYTGLSYVVVYQLFRWVSTIFFLVLLYLFLAHIFSSPEHRRLSFLWITLSAGLGWVLIIMKYTVTQGELIFPLDIYIAEGNTFFNIMAGPILIDAAGFILWTFLLLLKADQTRRLRYAVYAGVVAFLLGWHHTYDLWIIWGIPAAYIGVRLFVDRKLPMFWVKSLLIVGAITWPPALYAVLLTTLNPIWDEVLAQFANAGVYSPTIPHMFIYMGLSLILAIITLILRARERFSVRLPNGHPPINSELFVITWFIAGWALIYIPVDYQVHLINGWQIPTGILATVALIKYILPFFEERFHWKQLRPVLIYGVLGFVALTNLYLWSWRFVDLARYDYPYYLHKKEVAALEWLEDNTQPGSIVLSSLTIGQYVPGLSNRTAFLAHWAQTVDFYSKVKLVNAFYSSQTDDRQRQTILEQYEIDYVIYGSAERKLGHYRPASSPLLQKVYDSSEVDIYRVQSGQSIVAE